jgi:hypothetical protein
MPISAYNPMFGGKSGSASKAKAAMIERYGQVKGTKVFYATLNKKKSQGKSFYRRRGDKE